MLNKYVKKTAAALMAIVASAGFIPGISVSAETRVPVSEKISLRTPNTRLSRTVSQSKITPEFSGKYTQSYLEAVQNGTNIFPYKNGDLTAARNSLSELVSYYCSMKTSVQFYDCGTCLELTESCWPTVERAVARADAGWKTYENRVSQACYSLNLNASDVEIVNQINEYICANFDYEVTNESMANFIETGRGQCFHYAKMFADMCNAVAIPARKVQNSEHAWDEVTLNGVTYTFDPTYNDTGSSRSAYSWLRNGKVSVPSSSTASVKSGWVKSGGKWRYYSRSGSAMISIWVQDGGKWYYMDANGYMATNTWIDGCYVDGSGAWVK